MKLILTLVLCLFLSACSSHIKRNDGPETTQPASPESVLQARLAMLRSAEELGFEEKHFDPCVLGVSRECGSKFFTVIHFQLLCRDSEGTISEVPLNLRPILAPRLGWKVGAQSGFTQTDIDGYGRLAVINHGSLRRQRLILRMGKQFVGVTASEVNKLVLPSNWCT